MRRKIYFLPQIYPCSVEKTSGILFQYPFINKRLPPLFFIRIFVFISSTGKDRSHLSHELGIASCEDPNAFAPFIPLIQNELQKIFRELL